MLEGVKRIILKDIYKYLVSKKTFLGTNRPSTDHPGAWNFWLTKFITIFTVCKENYLDLILSKVYFVLILSEFPLFSDLFYSENPQRQSIEQQDFSWQVLKAGKLDFCGRQVVRGCGDMGVIILPYMAPVCKYELLLPPNQGFRGH